MIEGDPIYVIEPHCDDAFLSLGWSIGAWAREGRRVEVVTVYSDDDVRARESARWATSVGATWRGLGHRASDAIALVGVTITAAEPVPALPNRLLPEVMTEPSACRIWPLGLEHPEHVAVAAVTPVGDLRYIDTPYQLSLYHQTEVRRALDGRTFEWWLRPPRRKWDAAKLFASQARLFEHHTPDKLEAAAEIVVR
ncbi:MAG: hypothetical protein ACRDWD_03150 [Acidimicrobiia bacterium]